MTSLNGGGRKQTLRLAVLASWGIGRSILRTLSKDDRVTISMVLTRFPDANDPWKEVVMDEAGKHHLPVLSFEGMSFERMHRVLAQAGTDLLMVHAYPSKLPPKVFEFPRLGTVNIHPSLLPAYPGADPTARILEEHQPETGLTAHYMDDEYDSGNIICQKSIPVFGDDTREKVINRLKAVVPELVRDTITRLMTPEFKGVPQTEFLPDSETKEKKIP